LCGFGEYLRRIALNWLHRSVVHGPGVSVCEDRSREIGGRGKGKERQRAAMRQHDSVQGKDRQAEKKIESKKDTHTD
jgi:hypothetical protein